MGVFESYMIKERHYSPKYDFQTGSIAKLFFILSVILFAIAGVEFVLSVSIFLDASIFFALGILCLGITGISWFFHSQFSKLSDIVSEIENGEFDEK